MAVSAYKDISSLFTTEVLEIVEKPAEKVPKLSEVSSIAEKA